MMLNEDIKHSLPFVPSNQSLTQSNKIQLTKMDQKVSTMKTMTTCRKSFIYRQIICILIVSCFTTIMAAPMPTTTIASAGTTTTVLSRKTLKNPNKSKKYSEKKISIPTPQTIDFILAENSMESFVTSTASVPTSLVYSSLDDVIEATTMLPSTITTTTPTTSTISTTIETGNNEKSPVTMMAIETMISTTPLKTESFNSYDGVRNNEMVSRRLQTNDNLIEGLLKTEASMNIHHPESSNDNLSTLIHAQIVINAKDDNKNKSINLNGQKDDDKYDDITKPTTSYIKHHTDDDLKLMDNERDVEINLDTSTSIPEKKMPKTNKKKAQYTMENKKQKLKLKVVESTTMSSIFSTSIKTAPTTIKSTTLTTTKSFEMENDEMTTEAATKEKLLMQLNSMVPTTSEVIPETTTTTTNESHDKIIILNSDTSGLIVVDIMENFGKANISLNNTEGEAFEIKMDLIEDTTDITNNESNINQIVNGMQKTVMKDDIFMTAATLSSIITGNDDENVNGRIESTTKNDDIILINESTSAPIIDIPTKIKWNAVKNVNDDGNIKIMFDNINLPSQHVNVSIENGELMIDNIDISILNKAEEEYQRLKNLSDFKDDKSSKSDSLEIILIEDLESLYSTTIESSTTKVLTIGSGGNDEQISHHNSFPTTIQFELPNKVKHNNKMEMDGSAEDEIKIKTTNKDSDTIFYISNTEVKVIESMPTALPEKSHYYPAIYEEDVIVDFPDKNHSTMNLTPDKYEEDIVLSPLTSDFDPKDINYIGEAFLDVEESQNGQGSFESHHIIPLTSDVVIQPVSLQDSPPVGVPIIGEVPPQIELEEMVFNDDYDSSSKQTSNFHFEEYYPNFLGNRLVKNQLTADVPKELISDPRNGTFIVNRTHTSINTVINGTNVTTLSSPFSNSTAYLLENDDNDNNGGKVACMNNFYITILYYIIY